MSGELLAYVVFGSLACAGAFFISCEIRYSRQRKRDAKFQQHIDRYRRGNR